MRAELDRVRPVLVAPANLYLMKIRRFVTQTAALVFFAVSPSVIPIGAPPQEPGTPGVAVVQAL
jgi:hypothetical protein